MVLYPYALFLHILGVLALFIALGLEQVSISRMRCAINTIQLREWARANAIIERLFPFSSLAIFVTGLYMTIVYWGFGHAWIDISLVALIALSGLGSAVVGKKMKAIDAILVTTSEESISPALAQLIQDPLLLTLSRIMSIAALGIIFLMTVKPEGFASLVTVVVTSMLGIILIQLMNKMATSPSPSA